MIDVTPIFFQLIQDITTLPYDELENRHAFREMRRYIDLPYREQYTLTICNKYTLFFEDANEIFYKTHVFLTDVYDESCETILQTLEKAISIMQSFVKTDELADMFSFL